MIAVVAPAGLTAIVFLFSMVRKCGAIVCLSALLMVIVGFISAISGGAHLALALLTGDLCYEMDMHLYQYDYLQATKNASESISFLPADTVPCGSTGELAFLSTELNSNLDKAMGGACGAVVTLCNANNNFAKYWLDCSVRPAHGPPFVGVFRVPTALWAAALQSVCFSSDAAAVCPRTTGRPSQ